jgi:hypothetical protein
MAKDRSTDSRNQRGNITQVINGEATNCVQIGSSTDGATINQTINGNATNCIQVGDVYGDINL